MTPIKVAIADDHVLFRKGIVAMLEMEGKFDIVLEANNGEELIQRIQFKEVDVVLMDLEMPVMDGITATRELASLKPEVKVIFITSHDEDEMVMDAVNAGAKGYLLKDADPEEVVEAILSAWQNGFYFKENVSRLLLKGIVSKDLLKPRFDPKEVFTERENDVLKLLCQELTTKEIADKLSLSPRTVEGYRKIMQEKIGARNTVGLVIFAMKNNLVD